MFRPYFKRILMILAVVGGLVTLWFGIFVNRVYVDTSFTKGIALAEDRGFVGQNTFAGDETNGVFKNSLVTQVDERIRGMEEKRESRKFLAFLQPTWFLTTQHNTETDRHSNRITADKSRSNNPDPTSSATTSVTRSQGIMLNFKHSLPGSSTSSKHSNTIMADRSQSDKTDPTSLVITSSSREIKLNFEQSFVGLSTSKRMELNSQYFSPKKSAYGDAGCPENPRRNYETLLELFRYWQNLSTKHRIKYVLAFGSLLGAVRDGDVIPYDSDIDILIDVNYFSVMRRLAVVRNFTTSDMKIRLVVQPEFMENKPVEARRRYDCLGQVTPKMIDGCSFQEPLGRVIKGDNYIDIFHFYDRVNTVDDPSEDSLKEYLKEQFYPFKPCSFMGFKAFCPNKPWDILRAYFKSDDLEPQYMCKEGRWVDRNGEEIFLATLAARLSSVIAKEDAINVGSNLNFGGMETNEYVPNFDHCDDTYRW